MICIGSGCAGGNEGGGGAKTPADGDARLHGNAQTGHRQAQLRKNRLVAHHGKIFLRGVFRFHALEEQTLRQLLKGQGVI